NISHDKINYYLKNAKLTPRLLWDNVKDVIMTDDNGYVIFDDSILDKSITYAGVTKRMIACSQGFSPDKRLDSVSKIGL
ncbi:hypothetical protein PN492_14415, partial [Dolichospermum circinale CS-537/01]|nr:hypothetical protein [Dolichospermum circinale CS-537/01]